MDGLCRGLAVGQSQFFLFQIDEAPFKGLNFRQAASRQEQEAEGSNSVFGFRVYLRSRQRLSETLQFRRRQEPVALAFRLAFDILARIGVLVAQPQVSARLIIFDSTPRVRFA